MVHDSRNFIFHFELFFVLLLPTPTAAPLTAHEIKISKKKNKKNVKISFDTCVQKTMTRCCTVPEIWCKTDRGMEKVTYRGGCPT